MSNEVSNIHIYTRQSNVKIKGPQVINNLQMIRVNKRSWNFKRIKCQFNISFWGYYLSGNLEIMA